MATRAEWADRVRRWRASQQTAGKFADFEGIKVGTLRHWAWRLERDARDATSPAFVEVVMPAQGGWSGVEVLLRDGICVRVARDFDESTLVRVIAIVEGR
jgi:hypothetical protein